MEGVRTSAIWARAEQAPLARALADITGLSILRAGGPDQGPASQLGADRLHDIRRAIVEGPEDVILILTPTSVDARTLRTARSRHIVSTEPLPCSALTLRQEGWLDIGSEFRLAAGMRFWRGIDEAAVALAEIGRPPMVVARSTSAPHESTLGARLFDAADAIVSLMGEPTVAFASWSPAGQPIPESLASLSGSMSVTLAFADGRSAGIIASDRASWTRSVELLSPRGGIYLSDRAMVWNDPSGFARDRWDDPAPASAWPAADALATGVRVAIESQSQASPTSLASVLALCQAALLSVRTGQAESIETLRRLAEA